MDSNLYQKQQITPTIPFIGLVDCDNFFVSCERVFQPKLKRVPLVILSSNDGCAVSRSNEAKKLGIRMGAPLHEFQEIVREHEVVTLSSNFSLYGDLSNRVMRLLQREYPSVDRYSVDETFIRFSHRNPLKAKNSAIKTLNTIQQCLGIPISIGIATTKVLTKIACYQAKNNSHYNGICLIGTEPDRLHTLQKTPISKVWGIGRRYSEFLTSRGIHTALDFTEIPQSWVKRHMSILGLRLQMELQGLSNCFHLGEEHEAQKSLLRSRSFGQPVTDKASLAESLAAHATSAGDRLRREGLVASGIGVFIRTSPYAYKPQYSNSLVLSFDDPTDYTPDLIHKATEALTIIYKPNYEYKKTGIFLTGLMPKETATLSLFKTPQEYARQANLMKIFDTLRQRWGKEGCFFAARGVSTSWHPKTSTKTPRYTTNWKELPRAVCQ